MKTNMSLVLTMALILSGCGSSNPDLQPIQQKPASKLMTGQTAKLTNPKVNVLFVVDNSGSMKGYQEKLVKNMEVFSKEFFKSVRIDYKIGVVPVYDSKYLNDKTVYKSGLRKMNPLGELVKLKGLAVGEDPNQIFITRDTINAKQVLEATVALGTQWGPEAEESFSPVLAMMDPKINAEKNQNFYDPEAYLAIIFLTDADDVTLGLSGEDFYRQLVALKGGDRSKILIAAALPNIKNHSVGCTTDGAGPVQSFPALLARSGGILADLCSANFGQQLASFAKLLVKQVGTQKITIDHAVDIDSMEVSYGNPDSNEAEHIKIQRGLNGYLFNPKTLEITISSELNLERQENAVIFVKATEANLGNLEDGRTVKH